MVRLVQRRNLRYKKDVGKSRVELLPIEALLAVTNVFQYGAEKYRAWSWRGLPNDRTYASVLRHLFAWKQGEAMDPESGLSHLAHAASQIMIMIENEEVENAQDDSKTSRSTD